MAVNKNSQTLKWKGEVEFEGSIDKFKEFTKLLADRTFKVRPDIAHVPGRITPGKQQMVALINLVNEATYMPLTANSPRLNFDIRGGILTPHLHIGDDVYLVDREAFKTILGDVAKEVYMQRVEKGGDFNEMVGALTEPKV